jgi:hypothetical protein
MAVSTIDALYNGTSEKLTTSATGITVTGNATFADNGKAIFGAGSDLQIYHDGSNSYVQDAGDGALILNTTNGGGVYVYSAGETMATFNSNGAVNLYYDNAAKLATTSTGIDVTGTAVTDGLTANGAAEGDTYFTGGTASSRLLNVFTSTHDGGANAGHNFKIASGQGAFIFGNNTTANLLTVKSGGIDVTGTVTSDGLIINNGVVKGERGTASAPAYSFGDDADTGMFNISNANLGFSVSGTERMRIDSSGNVGIGGTAEPSSTAYNTATLHLRQVGSSSVGSQLRFTSGNSGHTNTDGGFISYWADNNFYFNNLETGDFRFFSGGSERMRIDASGAVGLSTTPPAWNTGTSGRIPLQFGFGSVSGRLNDLHVEFTNNAYASGTGNDPQWAGMSRWAKSQIELNSAGGIEFKSSPVVSASAHASSPNVVWTKNMEIDLAGRATTPNQPSFHAVREAGHVYGNNTRVTVVFNTVEHNIGGHYNSSNGIFTAPIDGRYLFMANGMSMYNQNGDKQLSIHINGVAKNISNPASTTTGGARPFATYLIADLSANDTAYVSFYSNVTADALYGAGGYWNGFNGYLLG